MSTPPRADQGLLGRLTGWLSSPFAPSMIGSLLGDGTTSAPSTAASTSATERPAVTSVTAKRPAEVITLDDDDAADGDVAVATAHQPQVKRTRLDLEQDGPSTSSSSFVVARPGVGLGGTPRRSQMRKPFADSGTPTPARRVTFADSPSATGTPSAVRRDTAGASPAAWNMSRCRSGILSDSTRKVLHQLESERNPGSPSAVASILRSPGPLPTNSLPAPLPCRRVLPRLAMINEAKRLSSEAVKQRVLLNKPLPPTGAALLPGVKSSPRPRLKRQQAKNSIGLVEDDEVDSGIPDEGHQQLSGADLVSGPLISFDFSAPPAVIYTEKPTAVYNRSDSPLPPPSSVASKPTPAPTAPLTTTSTAPKWRCADCWTDNPCSTGVCLACNAKKPQTTKQPTATLPPLSASLPKTSKWSCKECWSQNEDCAAKCGACGTDKSGHAPAPQPQRSTNTWTCPKCQSVNNWSASTCKTCVAKENDKSETSSSQPLKMPPAQANKWTCPTCCVPNEPTVEKCVCCSESRPAPKTSTTANATTTALPLPMLTESHKSGQWECQTCLVRNKETDEKCIACRTGKPMATPARATEPTTNEAPWTCTSCSNVNLQAARTTCSACNAKAPLASASRTFRLKPMKRFERLEARKSVTIDEEKNQITYLPPLDPSSAEATPTDATAAALSNPLFAFGAPTPKPDAPAVTTAPSGGLFGFPAADASKPETTKEKDTRAVSISFGIPKTTTPATSAEALTAPAPSFGFGTTTASVTAAPTTSATTTAAAPLFAFGASNALTTAVSSTTATTTAADTVKSTAAAPLFGLPTTATTSSTAPLFGAAVSATSAAAPFSLFGASATTTVATDSTTTTTSAAAAPLFAFGTPAPASTTAPAPSLFATSTPAFGALSATASSAAPGAGSLFSLPSAATTTTASALFGAAAASSKSLFPTATTAAPTNGLFGTMNGHVTSADSVSNGPFSSTSGSAAAASSGPTPIKRPNFNFSSTQPAAPASSAFAFGGAPAPTAPTTTASNAPLFGSSAAPSFNFSATAPAAGSLFGSATATATTSAGGTPAFSFGQAIPTIGGAPTAAGNAAESLFQFGSANNTNQVPPTAGHRPVLKARRRQR